MVCNAKATKFSVPQLMKGVLGQQWKKWSTDETLSDGLPKLSDAQESRTGPCGPSQQN